MNITAISLRNFRGFQDSMIELKPLTVLLGPNSAGKSSFGHALAAMAHAHKIYRSGVPVSLTPPKTEVDKWPVDLGEFNDLRTTGTNGRVQIGLKTRTGMLELGFGGLSHSPDLILSYVLHPSGVQSASTASLGTDTPRIAEGVKGEIIPAQYEQIATDKRGVVTLEKINELEWREGKEQVSTIFAGLVLNAVQHMAAGTAQVLSGAARDDLGDFLDNLTYLRANRKRPSRSYQDDVSYPQPIGYSGECAPSILFKQGEMPVQYHWPTAIPNSVADAKSMTNKWEPRESKLKDAVGQWLSWFHLGTQVDVSLRSELEKWLKLRVTLESQSSHDITEIGFGVSQIIPVLVAGLLQQKEGPLVVDLPEGHLHPRAQGLIADFFCSMVATGQSALVETHSEMFFNRLRLRAAMNPELMKDIAAYFISQPKDGICSRPRPVGLRFEDEVHWPDGFLQDAWETENRINAVRKSQSNE